MITPDGQTLIYSDGGYSEPGEQGIKLMNLKTLEVVATLEGSKGMTPGALARDGRTLAAIGENTTIELWDVPTRKRLAILKGHERDFISVTFSPDGKHLASASTDGTLRLWTSAGK